MGPSPFIVLLAPPLLFRCFLLSSHYLTTQNSLLLAPPHANEFSDLDLQKSSTNNNLQLTEDNLHDVVLSPILPVAFWAVTNIPPACLCLALAACGQQT